MSIFKVQHIDHVVLRVEDMERSLEFYIEVLGCSIKKRNEEYEMIHLAAGNSMIDLVDIHGPLGAMGGGAPGKERRNVDHFCLRVEPFDEDAILTHLEGHGIAADNAVTRYGAQGVGPSIYCVDPDGNQIELKGPAQPGTA
ncbi:VOC family protein [Pseudomonas sp. NPDC089422]|uniref:VOC family protein n=1 Tax=Pseudomonas sp. NPDC089422 TaxID=3364466 RepID=UPI0037FB5308